MPRWSLDDFKRAVHDNKGGIYKKLTLDPIPPPEQIIAQAQTEFLEKSGLKDSDNVDEQLTWLLDVEYEIYQYHQSKVYTSFLKEMTKWSIQNPGVHPCLDYLAEKLNYSLENLAEELLDEEQKILMNVIPNEVALAIVALEGSVSQGRVTRAGNSLMEQLQFVLDLHGFHRGVHFEREMDVVGQQPTRLDYVFPNVDFMIESANQSVTCANMTTINDRYRLAIQQLQPNTNRKVLCALGAKAYSASIKKCSPNILQAFHKNQIKVVVLENAIGKIKDSTGTVQSYSDWFQELKILSKFW